MDMTFSENYLAQFEEKLPIFHVEKSNKVKWPTLKRHAEALVHTEKSECKMMLAYCVFPLAVRSTFLFCN
jgi:hypothetical protein